MIVCKDYFDYYVKESNGTKVNVVFCGLYTGATPSTLPTNAEGIENFPPNFDPTKVQFGAGSTLFCTDTGDIYVADEEGEWQLQ